MSGTTQPPRVETAAFEAASFGLADSAQPLSRPVGGTVNNQRRKPRDRPTTWWQVVKQTFSQWQEDHAPRLGAALAYYTVFSVAPLLVIVVAVAGFVLGEQAVTGGLHEQMQNLLGPEAAQGVEDLVASAHDKPKAGVWATVLGVIALVFGASGVFAQLKDALNTIWDVEAKPGRGIWGYLKDYTLSFAMVLSIAFLLLVSLAVSAMVGVLMKYLSGYLQGYQSLLVVIDLGISVGVVTLLLALIFKYLPDVEIGWRDVWLGALVTAGLFTLGKFLIGLYLGQAAIGSSYGAAGSLVIVMIWAYYSAQILFMGAEFTKAHAAMRGTTIKPRAYARLIEENCHT